MEEENNKGWIGNILDSLCKTFSSFIGIFKKHGIIYSIFIMVIFIIFYTLIINPIRVNNIIEKRLEMAWQNQKQTEKEEQQKSIERRIEANNIVGDIMVKLIDKYEPIHRIILLEAHNSIQSLNLVDMIYYSATQEMLTPNSREFHYLSDDLQRQMRFNLLGNSLLNTLKHRPYIYNNDIKNCTHPEHRLYHKLAEYDSECILIPFLNENNDPTLLIVISGDNLPVNDIIEYIDDFRKQIEHCLM